MVGGGRRFRVPLQDRLNLVLQNRYPPLHRHPYLFKVDREVAVDEDVAHANDAGPRNLEGQPPARRVARNGADGLENILEPGAVIPHRGIASWRTRSRRCGRSAGAVIAAPLRPSNASRSIWSWAWSSRLRPSSRSTRMSTSLSGPASPRATDPNTRTWLAPCRWAMARTSSRAARR